MNLIKKFQDVFKRNGGNVALNCNGQEYHYHEFLSMVEGSRSMLEQRPEYSPQQPVAVLCDEQVWTYAAVFAIWFSGGIFIPLSPDQPAVVNESLIRKHGIKFIFAAGTLAGRLNKEEVKILNNEGVGVNEELPLYSWQENDRLYILTTSGSTGIPKTVPINLLNVEAFVEGFLEVYPELDASDNFLQTYELTADASFTGYLIPLLLGATVYTLPKGGFKPFEVAKVMARQPISWVQVTPTLLACLRPFFHSLNPAHIKHFHFGGEALPADLVEEWRKHVPNAEVSNVYGPTETTITVTSYKCLPDEPVRSRNNIVSIGKPFKNVKFHIIREPSQRYGELCLAGQQVMEGYLYTAQQSFISDNADGRKYYPTGDFVEVDAEGYLFYYGRKDEQVKVNGYRIDLIEIENMVRSVVEGKGMVAATVAEVSSGIQQLVVFIENFAGNGDEILNRMYRQLPRYKVPERIIGVDKFPISSAGKTDKKLLIAKYLKDREK